MTIGILCAMTKEHDLLVGMLDNPRTEHGVCFGYTVGNYGQNTVILLKCGIGKVNAALGTSMLIQKYAPGYVISSGCAGAVSKDLHVMDVVIGSEVLYHDVDIPDCKPGQIQDMPARFPCDKNLGLTDHVNRGLIVSGDQFVSARCQYEEIMAKFPDAKAVDMESAAIAHTCYLLNTPFCAIRIISDTPLTGDSKVEYDNFWERMSVRSVDVISGIIKSLL